MNSSSHMPERSLTPLYCLHQAAYFFAMAGVGSFAVTYLMARGFDAAQTGIMIASGNILSCALQPLIASHIDRTSIAHLQKVIPAFLVASFAAFASLELLSLPRLVVSLLYVLGFLSFSITIPLCNSLCAYYTKNGCSVNYGAGSGVGSLSFSFASLIFGFLIARLGPSAMMLVVLLCIVLQLILISRYPKIDASAAASSASAQANSLSISAFILRYRLFMVTMFGVICIAACHAMAESYLIQLFARMGGGSEHVGIALFLACTTAAPFMLFFERIQRRTGVIILMRLSGFFYIAKALLLIWAPSITSVYLIELLQTFTYAFIYPSLYYLVLMRISTQDMAKGQALASAMFTLGMALGNSLGGVFINLFGLNIMLAIAACFAIVGTILINATISRQDTPV